MSGIYLSSTENPTIDFTLPCIKYAPNNPVKKLSIIPINPATITTLVSAHIFGVKFTAQPRSINLY